MPGSEDATFAYWLADLYPTAAVMAVDIDASAISAGRAAQPSAYAPRIRFKTASFEELEPNSFDLMHWGVLAHEIYGRLERPVPLRLLSVPITDLCARLDKRCPRPEGDTVFCAATKPR